MCRGQPDLVVEIVSNSSFPQKIPASCGNAISWPAWASIGSSTPAARKVAFTLLTRAEPDWAEAPADAEGFRRSAVLSRRVRIDRGTTRVGTVKYDVLIQE